MVSERVKQIGASPTLRIAAKAKAMKAEGIDVVDLSIGEPDFPSPANVKAAGIKAIQDNFTKYTENDGTPGLKKAVIARFKEDFGLTYAPNEVIVSTGAKSSLFHVLEAIIDPGDEVIIPAPYWVTYPHLVKLAKGRSVYVETKEEEGFVLTAEALKAHITPATKAIILNSPSNPTGAAYSKAQLQSLADIVRGEEIYVIADEIYSSLVYDDFKFTSFASLGEDIKKKTILVNGPSKSYSMTGWRIGYALGPSDIIGGMAKIQSHTTSNAASISQMATQEALAGPQFEVAKMAQEFGCRRNYALMKLQSIPGLSCFKPQGAFYLFPNVRAYFDKEFNGTPIRNSNGMAYYLLREAGVAVVPGDSFGTDDYIRLSYATSMENLEKGLDRIIRALARLQPARQAKRVALSNYTARVRKPVPVDASLSVPVRDGLIAEVESRLTPENYFEWNAAINGVVVQLRTNVAHLYDFWVENWYPAQLEAGLEPHGVIYAVDGIPGREPRVLYNTDTKTGVVVNCDAYAPLRSLALGLVADVGERSFGIHAVRGMSVDAGGEGIVLIGPPGTKKTELFFGLLRDPRFRFHAADAFFVRYAGKTALADAVERKAFLPTASVEEFSRLAPLFDGSRCENVVIHKDDCKDTECLRGTDCRLDRGSPFCYKAAKDAVGLVDPNWIAGPAAVSRRTTLRRLFILRNDAFSPASVELSAEDALRILVSGESPGMKPAAAGKTTPFFNPHLLMNSPERIELQTSYFRRLLQSVPAVLFNSGAAGVDKIKECLGSGLNI
jgi:aspartate/methionine/tyrosine aminotransferase